MSPAASQAANLTAEAHELISFCHRNSGAVEVSLFGEIGSGLVDFRDRLFYSSDDRMLRETDSLFGMALIICFRLSAP